MCKMLYIVVHVGNSCVMKCSEMAVATSNLLAELIPKYLDQVCVYVVWPATPSPPLLFTMLRFIVKGEL